MICNLSSFLTLIYNVFNPIHYNSVRPIHAAAKEEGEEYKEFLHRKKIKRRATILLHALPSGYRQVALTTNKHRIVHAVKRELPVCLFSVVE